MVEQPFTPSILIVKPGAIDAATKEALGKAGVIVVETDDPNDARLIMPEPIALSGNDMVYAALSALDEYRSRSDAPAAMFVAGLRRAMKEARQAKPEAAIVRGPGGRFAKATGNQGQGDVG